MNKFIYLHTHTHIHTHTRARARARVNFKDTFFKMIHRDLRFCRAMNCQNV